MTIPRDLIINFRQRVQFSVGKSSFFLVRSCVLTNSCFIPGKHDHTEDLSVVHFPSTVRQKVNNNPNKPHKNSHRRRERRTSPDGNTGNFVCPSTYAFQIPTLERAPPLPETKWPSHKIPDNWVADHERHRQLQPLLMDKDMAESSSLKNAKASSSSLKTIVSSIVH